MSDSQSPFICITCKRPFPDDLKQEDSPRYFGQYGLMPKSDSDSDFGSEVRTILDYIKGIAEVLRYGEHKDIETRTYDTIFQLVGELSEEALRRQELSLDAMEEIWKREQEAKKATHARKEGGA